MKYPEIKCPYCRIGFGGIKVSIEKVKPIFFASRATKKKMKEGEKTSFQHLDIMWSYDSGLIKDCIHPETLKENLVSYDANQNPVFNEEFTNKLKELRHDFEHNPIDINKDTFEFGAYYIAFVECMNYGYVDGDDEEYDREGMTMERLKELYENGTNLKDALKSFLKKSEGLC